jgi:hypothetical protein
MSSDVDTSKQAKLHAWPFLVAASGQKHAVNTNLSIPKHALPPSYITATIDCSAVRHMLMNCFCNCQAQLQAQHREKNHE